MYSRVERKWTITHAGQLDVFPLSGGIVNGFHDVQYMIGERSTGTVRAIGVHSVGHIGEADAAKVFRITMSKLDFLPLLILSTTQIDRSAERIRIGNAQ